jgi:hypothetical protein
MALFARTKSPGGGENRWWQKIEGIPPDPQNKIAHTAGYYSKEDYENGVKRSGEWEADRDGFIAIAVSANYYLEITINGKELYTTPSGPKKSNVRLFLPVLAGDVVWAGSDSEIRIDDDTYEPRAIDFSCVFFPAKSAFSPENIV